MITGLKSLVQRDEDVHKLTKLVDNVSEMRFHAFAILSLYAALYVRSTSNERSLEVINTDYTGMVFNQTLIDQTLALVRFGVNHTSRAPPLLVEATSRYFSGDLINMRNGCETSEFLTSQVLENMRVNMVVAFKNLLQLATPSHQRSTLRQLYDLSSKDATVLCSRLSTSRDRLTESALEAHVKRYKRIALRKRDELDKALRDVMPDQELIDRLEGEFRALENNLEARRAEGIAQPDAAYASLLAEYPVKPRLRPRGFIGPLDSLERVLQLEREYIPATQSQEDQLLYR